MSSQRGNVQRTRGQKHQNSSAFKNTLHDKSKKTQDMNSMALFNMCARCQDIIQWKIKFKKYKPLSVPRKCVKCQEKTIKRAYMIICDPCVSGTGVCAKCGKNAGIVVRQEDAQLQPSLETMFRDQIKCLSERRRRTFLRYLNKLQSTSSVQDGKEDAMAKAEEKLKELKLSVDEDLESLTSHSEESENDP
ncbi:unnamed protein product [Darwinula stevensoni]|uniref:Uncharacterized protein n=1 Tax=Darwinula stevensoni TaxID=69355 RepID=A0A7R8XBN8_9CRUS|nr:unnamed protein product [Darwinula stevensoni]CAG0886650.1 unnamed protein product [Darwinula stevensoni]